MVHSHRDVQGGAARAAVFGVSDGLVSNVALIIGIAGATTDGSLVRLAGISGLLGGAISMAAGEWVSVRAHNELVERELDGLAAEHAKQVAEGIMADPKVALDVHAREELGVDPEAIGSPLKVAVASFIAFTIGAFIPLVPWLVSEGSRATVASVILGISGAAVVGLLLAVFTERSPVRTAMRQVLVAAIACAATYLIGNALGVSVG